MLVSLAVQPRTNRVTWSYFIFFVFFSPLQFHFLVSVAVHSTQFFFPVHLSIPSRSRSIAAYFFFILNSFDFLENTFRSIEMHGDEWLAIFFFLLLRLYFLYQSAISLLIIQWHLSISANIIWFLRSVQCDGRENVREIIFIKTHAASLTFSFSMLTEDRQRIKQSSRKYMDLFISELWEREPNENCIRLTLWREGTQKVIHRRLLLLRNGETVSKSG